MAKLGEICTVVSGTTPKTNVPEYWNGNINWITPAEIDESTIIIISSQRKITLAGVKSCGLTPFPAGTVILSSRAPIGKTAIAGTEMYCNQGFKNLICGEQIYNKYLFWFLRNNTQYLQSLGRGATFKEISKAIVENIEIPLPPLPEQRHIAAVLDKVSELIALRKRQLDLLDEMVKARFVEMFGDLVVNEKGWILKPLNDVCDVRDGTHDSPKYVDNGYPLLTSKNFTQGFVDFTNANLIDENDFNSINKRSKVDVGDIVMPMIGTIGSPVIIYTNQPFAIKNVALIKFSKSSLINIFVKEVLSSRYFFYRVQENNRGNAQKFIALGDIRRLLMPIPPIELQSQFADFVQQVEKSKATVQQGLERLNLLKSALMQEYFG